VSTVSGKLRVCTCSVTLVKTSPFSSEVLLATVALLLFTASKLEMLVVLLSTIVLGMFVVFFISSGLQIKEEGSLSYNEKLCMLFRNNSSALFRSISGEEGDNDPHILLLSHDDFTSLLCAFLSLFSFNFESLVSFTTETLTSSQCLANHIRYGKDNPNIVNK
jgi:hypothetical protein